MQPIPVGIQTILDVVWLKLYAVLFGKAPSRVPGIHFFIEEFEVAAVAGVREEGVRQLVEQARRYMLVVKPVEDFFVPWGPASCVAFNKGEYRVI